MRVDIYGLDAAAFYDDLPASPARLPVRLCGIHRPATGELNPIHFASGITGDFIVSAHRYLPFIK